MYIVSHYTVFPQLIKFYLYQWILEVLDAGCSPLNFEESESTLNWLWEEYVQKPTFFFLLHNWKCFSQVGLWLSFLPGLLLCYVLHTRINSLFSLLSLLFLSKETCLSDKTAAEYFLCCRPLRDCFDWQTYFWQLLFILTVVFKSLFCPLQATFFCVIQVFLCLLESILPLWLTE